MEIICINCPMGCPLTVTLSDGKVTDVAGATCKKGITYAEMECTNPTRIVTTTLPVRGGKLRMLPIKTERAIPKDKIFDCIRALKDITLIAPVQIGDVVAENICETGVNMVATRNV